MKNYCFAKHDFSKKVTDYAAQSSLSASSLRGSKFGYNYTNILTILEKRIETGNARLDDLAVAEKLYSNIKKMSHEKRAKVDYNALKSRAQSAYETLYRADLIEDRAEEQRNNLLGMLAKHINKTEQTAQKAYASQTIDNVIGAEITPIDAYKPSKLLYRAGKASVKTVVALAAAGVLAVGAIASGVAVYSSYFSSKNKPEQKLQESNYAKNRVNAHVTKPAPAPVPVLVTAPDTSNVPQEPAKKDAVPEPALVPAPVTAPDVNTAPQEQPVKKDDATPAPAQPEAKAPEASTPETKPVNASHGLECRAILHMDSYFDHDTSGASGTAKAIIDAGRWGLDIYGGTFVDHERYDGCLVDGKGSRIWAGAHKYVPLSKETLLFLEGTGGFEERRYTADFDTGDDIVFGNNSPFINAKLGLAGRKFTDDPENFGVGNKQNFVLVQGTRHFGESTENFNGDYDAWRANAKGRLMLNNDTSLEAGIARMQETYDNFLSQKKITADGGIRLHTAIAGSPAFIEARAVFQKLESEANGRKSDDFRVGPSFQLGWRIASGDTVAIDATLGAGYLFSRKDDNELFVNPGVTFWFGRDRDRKTNNK